MKVNPAMVPKSAGKVEPYATTVPKEIRRELGFATTVVPPG
jgi:hypothetical protein